LVMVGSRGGIPIRVFLVDDHELVRRGIRDLLWTENELVVVGQAATAQEALERIPRTRPHIAVLDIRLGEGQPDGIEVCQEVRSRHPEVACVMLTSFADDESRLASTLAGASAYVLKEGTGAALSAAIRRVAAGDNLLGPVAPGRIPEKVGGPLPEKDPLAGLTAQERRTLELISRGMTNRQIGEQMFLAEKTVKNYVSHLLAKLGMARRSEAAAFAARLSERRALRVDISGGGDQLLAVPR
jgi:two-component system, NarL family, response regulator DevR